MNRFCQLPYSVQKTQERLIIEGTANAHSYSVLNVLVGLVTAAFMAW